MSKKHTNHHAEVTSATDAGQDAEGGIAPVEWLVAARERVSDALAHVSGFVERQPLLAVGAATTVGFLFARLVRR
jgi:hypothetical protein